MASWISERSDEGIDAPSLTTFTIDSPDAYARVQAIFAADLSEIGTSTREIARLLRISKSATHRLIKAVPPELAERHRNQRYLRWLREAMEAKPESFSELAAAMMFKAGTLESEEHLLKAISRRRSAETAIGCLPRKGER